MVLNELIAGEDTVSGPLVLQARSSELRKANIRKWAAESRNLELSTANSQRVALHAGFTMAGCSRAPRPGPSYGYLRVEELRGRANAEGVGVDLLEETVDMDGRRPPVAPT